MSIRTGSLDLRTLLTAISVTGFIHFGLTGKVFAAERHEPKAQAPVVLPALLVSASPAAAGMLQAASYAPRGFGLVRFCERGRGVIESGRVDRFGRPLPNRLRCGL